jgi:hypothetical protein
MMEKIGFRCPPELLDAIRRQAKATGMTPGEWVRSLCEKATGVKVEVKMGLGGADERTRARVEKARLKGIKARAKESGK